MTTVVINVFDSEAGTTAEYSFNKSPVRLGRNPLNDLTLPFPFVSGWHGVVRFDEQGAKFFDLGSTNGTLHNGRRIQAGEAINVEGTLALTIGKLELRVQQRGADGFSPEPPPLGAPSLGAPPPGIPTAGFGAVPVAPPAGPVPAGPPPGYLPQSGFLPTAEFQAQVPVPPSHDALTKRRSPLPGGTKAHPATSDGSDSSPPGMGTAHVEMSDVHQLVNRLRPSYDNFRQGWSSMHAELGRAIEAMPAQMRGFAISILQREFPEISKEPEFVTMAEGFGSSAKIPAAQPGKEGAGAAAVAALSRSLCPDDEPPATHAEAQRFLSCVEDVLRASAKAFVELQKGQEEFGNQMGVRTIKEFTALHAAGTSENVLRYLLDWRHGGPHRTQELVGVYADLMIHQVALLNGVMAGVRSLLARLSPEEIERRVTAGWPTRASAVWKQYTERYRELSLEDKAVVAVVFGREFARAYAEVGGESGEGSHR